MQPKRIGVIDLGTNTFHLLIVEIGGGPAFRELHRERRFIKLAESGIRRIGPQAYQRGLDAMRSFQAILQDRRVEIIRAFGTAALRTAANGPDFVEEVRRETGISIDLITGHREAALIHRGVAQAVHLTEATDLIMDIGGGSVEFILANNQTVYWSQSFPVGVAVLYRDFHHTDPISEAETTDLKTFLSDTLQPLWEAAATHPPRRLIGASGTFDVLENLLAEGKFHPHHAVIDTEPFYPLCDRLTSMTLAERLAVPGMPASRADMIVVALLLLKTVLKHLHPKQIVTSEYAMKEGMIAEIIDQQT